MHTRVLKSSQIRTGFFLLPSMNKKKNHLQQVYKNYFLYTELLYSSECYF